MDYFSAIDISATGLDVERTRIDLVALNVANANTSSSSAKRVYKPLRLVAEAQMNHSFDSQLNNKLNNIQYDGVSISKIVSLNSDPRKVYEPGHPHADQDGFVFYPDINLTSEMLELITSRRSYEANTKVISAAKVMAEAALEIGRG